MYCTLYIGVDKCLVLRKVNGELGHVVRRRGRTAACGPADEQLPALGLRRRTQGLVAAPKMFEMSVVQLQMIAVTSCQDVSKT